MTHETVNHSQNFKDPVSGVHMNNVEGIHATLEKDSRAQFGRLSSVRNGHVYYLDLVVWRTNARLEESVNRGFTIPCQRIVGLF